MEPINCLFYVTNFITCSKRNLFAICWQQIVKAMIPIDFFENFSLCYKEDQLTWHSKINLKFQQLIGNEKGHTDKKTFTAIFFHQN